MVDMDRTFNCDKEPLPQGLELTRATKLLEGLNVSSEGQILGAMLLMP